MVAELHCTAIAAQVRAMFDDKLGVTDGFKACVISMVSNEIVLVQIKWCDSKTSLLIKGKDFFKIYSVSVFISYVNVLMFVCR